MTVRHITPSVHAYIDSDSFRDTATGWWTQRPPGTTRSNTTVCTYSSRGGVSSCHYFSSFFLSDRLESFNPSGPQLRFWGQTTRFRSISPQKRDYGSKEPPIITILFLL